MEIITKSLAKSYNLKKQIGSGTFGTVSIAQQNPKLRKCRPGAPGRLVAVKTLRARTDDSPMLLREVVFFARVPSHPNLVLLHEMMLDPESGCVNFVLELMDANLLQWIGSRNGRVFTTKSVMNTAVQLLHGIAHIHNHHFVHRDLKPENILVSRAHPRFPEGDDIDEFRYRFGGNGSQFTIKIADFGLSRPVDDFYDAEGHRWTSYVATRWYRSPEQILALPIHTPAVDIWAVGCLVVELCTLTPLFPGRDMNHMHELHLQVLGLPSPIAFGGKWSVFPSLSLNGLTAAAKAFIGIIYPEHIVSHVHHEVFAPIAQKCLQWDPQRRPAATDVLLMLRNAFYGPLYGAETDLLPRHCAARNVVARANSVG